MVDDESTPNTIHSMYVYNGDNCCAMSAEVCSPAQVPVPCWDVLVCQAGSHIKHDDGTLPMDVIPISKPAELLLTSCVPAVETDWTTVSVEVQRVHLHSNCCCKYCAGGSDQCIELHMGITTSEHRAPERTFILLLEVSGQMTLHKCGLSCTPS